MPLSNHTSELELLVSCARMSMPSETTSRIKILLRECLDWEYLIRRASEHRVVPLLYRSLTRVGSDAVPQNVLSQVRRICQENCRRNLILTRELLELLELLAAHEIPAIPYKGPVLAASVYGDLSLRQFSDLDMIIPIKDVPRAKQLLIQRGYRPEKEMSDADLQACLRAEQDITLLWDDRGINLELHWGIGTERSPIRIDPTQLWTGLKKISILGTEVLCPPPEDLLLILCIHGAKHRWVRLGWLCDVAEISRVYERMNWGLAIDNATRLGGRRILLLGLLLAKDLLGASLPEKIVRITETDMALPSLALQVKGWLLNADADQPVLGEVENYFLRLRESPVDRCKIALKLLTARLTPTSRDRALLPLSGFLMYFVYLLRPIRLAREYGFKPVRLFFKGIFRQ